MDWSTAGFPVYHQLLDFAHTHVHWVSDAIQSSHPLPPFLLPAIFPSIRVFSNELALHIREPKYWTFSISSVQFSHSVVFDSLQPHEPQHARPPCSSPNPRVHPNPGPLSRWCHPTISSSVIPFSSYPQSFPASGSFQMSQLSASCGQSIGVSASVNIQEWSSLGWTGWISL